MRRLVTDAGLAHEIEVDSAGVSAEHAGEPPDRRSQAEATRRGLDLRGLRARRVTAGDWDSFDLLLVTDGAVDRALRRQAPPGAPLAKVARITDFVDSGEDEVPDPYYGGGDGFRSVFDLLEAACAGILDHARARGEVGSLDR